MSVVPGFTPTTSAWRCQRPPVPHPEPPLPTSVLPSRRLGASGATMPSRKRCGALPSTASLVRGCSPGAVPAVSAPPAALPAGSTRSGTAQWLWPCVTSSLPQWAARLRALRSGSCAPSLLASAQAPGPWSAWLLSMPWTLVAGTSGQSAAAVNLALLLCPLPWWPLGTQQPHGFGTTSKTSPPPMPPLLLPGLPAPFTPSSSFVTAASPFACPHQHLRSCPPDPLSPTPAWPLLAVSPASECWAAGLCRQLLSVFVFWLLWFGSRSALVFWLF